MLQHSNLKQQQSQRIIATSSCFTLWNGCSHSPSLLCTLPALSRWAADKSCDNSSDASRYRWAHRLSWRGGCSRSAAGTAGQSTLTARMQGTAGSRTPAPTGEASQTAPPARPKSSQYSNLLRIALSRGVHIIFSGASRDTKACGEVGHLNVLNLS
jgi:hypothetical protein